MATQFLGLLLLVGPKTKLTCGSVKHQPGVLEKQTKRIGFGCGFQGLASRYGSEVQIVKVMAHFPNLRRRQPSTSHPVGRKHGQNVRGVCEIRPEVRNGGAKRVRAGVFSVEPG